MADRSPEPQDGPDPREARPAQPAHARRRAPHSPGRCDTPGPPDPPRPPAARGPRPRRTTAAQAPSPRRTDARNSVRTGTRTGTEAARGSASDGHDTRDGNDSSDTSGNLLWHGACLVRATAVDLAVLACHLLLYPTGVLPEHSVPLGSPDPAGPTPGPDSGHRPDPEHRSEPARPPGPAAAPAGPAEPTAVPADDCTHPPVLLLHGFVDNRSAFTLLRRSLRHHGWQHIQAVNYSPFTPHIRSAAEQLGAHIEQARARSAGGGRVDIVAHSLGGLIARYYVQRLGGDAYVRTLVTLGTPHSGTRAVPALTPHPLARQMRPGSAVLRELAAPAPGCRTRFVAFWSDLDQLMIPVTSARLEHKDLSADNVKVTGIGHLSLPVHGSVAAEIRRVLSEHHAPGPAHGSATDAA